MVLFAGVVVYTILFAKGDLEDPPFKEVLTIALTPGGMAGCLLTLCSFGRNFGHPGEPYGRGIKYCGGRKGLMKRPLLKVLAANTSRCFSTQSDVFAFIGMKRLVR